MTEAPCIALGRLAPVRWDELEDFARGLSEFCKVHVTPDHVITAQPDPGEIEIRWAGGEARVRLEAHVAAGLQNLRDTLGHMLETARAGLPHGLRWEAEGNLEGRLPPNFRLARVTDARRITQRFVRLRLAADDLGYMNQTGLHLRLLQPKDRHDPRWPRLMANGRTGWPGAAHLHMPVYTIRRIDPAAGWLDVDVFLHGNGPTCAWAQAARPGVEVGLTGPGGGWLPQGQRLCLGGDETALPVIARILETAAPDSRGTAVIEVGDAAEIQPVRAPVGVRLVWLVRGRGDPALPDAFTALASGADAADPATEILFGGEKSDALAIRAALRDRFGRLPDTVSVASYWVRAEGESQ
jgi:NADPH-dependent ferric siderophore reductase